MSDLEKAKLAAWRAAYALAQGDRKVAGIVQDRCELTVLRRLVSQHLQRGEAEYWQLVEEEIKR